MAKTGPLNKYEKYYIEGHIDTMSVDELAKEMDRSKSSISKYVLALADAEQELHEKSFDVGQPIPTQNNPVVMTEGESQIGDLLHEMRGSGPKITDRMSKCIAPSKKQ